MSIRPVDMQIIVPKSSEILKSNNNLTNRHDKDQLDFSNFMKKETDIKEKQVFQLNKSENNIDTNKKRENNKKKYKKEENKKNTKKNNNNQETSNYNITI